MKRTTGLGLAAVLLLALAVGEASAQYNPYVRRDGGITFINPWAGRYIHQGYVYNPYTGRYVVGMADVNAFTGEYQLLTPSYNPYTNRFGFPAATYNSYTGRYGGGYSGGHFRD